VIERGRGLREAQEQAPQRADEQRLEGDAPGDAARERDAEAREPLGEQAGDAEPEAHAEEHARRQEREEPDERAAAGTFDRPGGALDAADLQAPDLEAAAPDAVPERAVVRVLFSVCFGFGVAGLLAERFASFGVALGCGIAGGIAFEALLVGPLWRLLLRFSQPATTLDHSLFSTARAVTSFDKNGHGLVSLEVDGQVVQLLARLDSAGLDTARSSGVRVHVGDELLVEEIDDVRQQCRVSLR
jgi:hypothetical protein